MNEALEQWFRGLVGHSVTFWLTSEETWREGELKIVGALGFVASEGQRGVMTFHPWTALATMMATADQER